MRIDYSLIPESTMESLLAYKETGRPTGDFVRAVLENNLKEAFARADDNNIRAMFHTVSWLYNEMPSGAWGNEQRVRNWLKYHQDKREAEMAPDGTL